MKKYRLLNDTPTIKAGAIFKLNNNQEYECNIDRLGNSSIYIPEYVENNPHWFEEIKESAEDVIKTALYKEFCDEECPVDNENAEYLTNLFFTSLHDNNFQIVKVKNSLSEDERLEFYKFLQCQLGKVNINFGSDFETLPSLLGSFMEALYIACHNFTRKEK